MYIFEDLKSKNLGIKQCQVIQKEIDLLEITIISDAEHDQKVEVLITLRIRNDIHPAFKTVFNYTDCVHREKSWKLRVIKPEL